MEPELRRELLGKHHLLSRVYCKKTPRVLTSDYRSEGHWVPPSAPGWLHTVNVVCLGLWVLPGKGCFRGWRELLEQRPRAPGL